MGEVNFAIKNYHDLLNLHKALLEAKFHRNPDNEFVSASPIIARLCNEIVDQLAKHDLVEKGKEDWTSWRMIKNRNDYMEKAIDNAVFYDSYKRNSEWAELSFEEKCKWGNNFLAPFTTTDKDIATFIDEVTRKLNLDKVSKQAISDE